MDSKLRAAIRRAAATGPDMREPNSSKGYVPPKEGLAYARLVGYFELGTHEEEFEGNKRDQQKVDLIFELSGPNHEPRKLDDGTLVPVRILVQETLTFNEKTNFFKLFAAMNYASKATHMAELLGDPFMVEVFHKKSGDGKKVYANLKGPNGYNIKGTTVQDPISGKSVVVEVAPAITELKAFVWDIADKDMWESIFIEGEYAERREGEKVIAPARPKNVIQERIMAAKNWPEHPLYPSLVAEGLVPEVRAIELARIEAIERQEYEDMLRVREWVKGCVSEALTESHGNSPRRRPGKLMPRR